MDSKSERQLLILSIILLLSIILIIFSLFSNSVLAEDLPEIKKRGVLRHLGIPYARFVSEDGQTGLDVELVQRFAQHLNLKYEYVKTDWLNVISDLTGQKFHFENNKPVVDGTTVIRGDIISNGLTILPWRQHLIDFSIPTFPTGIWLVARADSLVRPIASTGDIQKDIASVRALLKNKKILTMEKTCLDQSLYGLQDTGAEIIMHDPNKGLNDMVPAIIRGEAEMTILDIPDALIALETLAGDINHYRLEVGSMVRRLEAGVFKLKLISS